MTHDWDDAFANGKYIKGAENYADRWKHAAKAFRKSHPHCALDIVYGPNSRCRTDLFHADDAIGTLIFVHGGYWRAFDKSYWSHLAAGANANGWNVAIPSYPLAPKARISEISAHIIRAIIDLAERLSGPIHLSGHSAGGHLVTRALCKDSSFPPSVFDRIRAVISISGVHDLRPLCQTAMNADLRLDHIEATHQSPSLHQRACGPQVTAWVGQHERPEFLRQSQLLVSAWDNTEFVVAPGHHHFSVIEDLVDPNSDLTRRVLNID